MQEICVDIAVPDTYTIPGIQFKRQVLQWQGQLFPQDLVQAKYEYFDLTQVSLPNFVTPHLPRDLQQQSWQCLSVEYDDALTPDEFASPADVFGERGVFFDLLARLVKNAEKWIITFDCDCDQPEEIIEGNLELAFEKIKECLHKNTGFIMYQGSKEVLS